MDRHFDESCPYLTIQTPLLFTVCVVKLDQGLALKCSIGFNPKFSPFLNDMVGFGFYFLEKCITLTYGMRVVVPASERKKKRNHRIDNQCENRLMPHIFYRIRGAFSEQVVGVPVFTGPDRQTLLLLKAGQQKEKLARQGVPLAVLVEIDQEGVLKDLD